MTKQLHSHCVLLVCWPGRRQGRGIVSQDISETESRQWLRTSLYRACKLHHLDTEHAPRQMPALGLSQRRFVEMQPDIKLKVITSWPYSTQPFGVFWWWKPRNMSGKRKGTFLWMTWTELLFWKTLIYKNNFIFSPLVYAFATVWVFKSPLWAQRHVHSVHNDDVRWWGY